MKHQKLRSKLIGSVGALIFAALCVMSVFSYISLNSAYNRTIEATKGKLDQITKSQVECMLGVLQTVYGDYQSGALGEEEAKIIAGNIVRNTRYNNGVGYFWADMADGTNAVHIKPEVEGTNRYNSQDEKGNYFVQDTIRAGDQPGGGFIDFYFAKPGESEAKAKRAFIGKFEPYGWYIGTGNYEEDMLPLIQAELDASKRAGTLALVTLVLAGLAILVVGIVVMGVIAQKISKPVEQASQRLLKLSEGDLHSAVEVSHSGDEIGTLTQSLAATVEGLRSYIDNISQVLSEVDKGNIAVTIDFDCVGDFAPIKNSLLQTVALLKNTFQRIHQSSEQVASGSGQVAASAQALSQGATEQASAVQELAATIVEISEHVKQNAQNAHDASQQAKDTATELQSGRSKMNEMTQAIDKINSASGEVGKIVKTIEDIAFQTNILALNAAVEAARAGAAGKGFAVVADEVRNLASKSAEASKSTTVLIESILQSVQAGTEISHETAASLERIVAFSGQTAELVHKISNASQEQAVQIAQVTQGIDQISSVVQTNSATAEQSAASSEELSGQAQVLQQLVKQFRLDNAGAISDGMERRMNGEALV